MEEKIVIVTDASGKKLYETTNETNEFYQNRLDQLNRWITDLDKYEELELKYKTGQDFNTLRNLYSLDALVTITSIDLSIITTELYLNKSRMKQIFYMKQVYLLIYEAYETYNSKKQFLRNLIQKSNPLLIEEFNAIGILERVFIKDFKLTTLIKNVRHKVGGHIDREFRTWYDTVITLDPHHTANMAIAFMQAFSPIQHLTMKLAGVEHEKFIKHNNDSTNSFNELLGKIEDLTAKVNEKRPDGQKLDFDMNVFRNMLK